MGTGLRLPPLWVRFAKDPHGFNGSQKTTPQPEALCTLSKRIALQENEKVLEAV